MLLDASVARNFAILGWTGHLCDVCGGKLRIAHGILGMNAEEPGELDAIRGALERETLVHQAGSPAYASAIGALAGIEELIAAWGRGLEVVVPTAPEFAFAARLQDVNERPWLRGLGVRARRLDAGEAVSIAIAIARHEGLATDDEDGRRAFVALGGEGHSWTLDLVQRAVARGLLREGEARAGYERLRHEYRFWGPPWRDPS